MHGQHHRHGRLMHRTGCFRRVAEWSASSSSIQARIGQGGPRRLRQHLIDMNEVVLRAAVHGEAGARWFTMDVTGSGEPRQSIRTMVVPMPWSSIACRMVREDGRSATACG